MTESEKEVLKAQRNQQLAESKDVQRITAIIHLNELASKNSIIHDWLLDYHKEVLEFANNCGIKPSKINPNDILTTIHSRIEDNNADGNVSVSRNYVGSGGNGILSDL